MIKNRFPGGQWPVMLTPFTKDNKVDYLALNKLVDWYIENGANGLFAVCQSSEMFHLSLEERIAITKAVVEAAKDRVPVIASGHVSNLFEDQVREINEISKTGVKAVILITNRLAKEDESDEIWLKNLKSLLDRIDKTIPLGLYECPYPYKRLISLENLKWCAQTDRFYFLKDTCCDIHLILDRLKLINKTNLRLYNANTTTLLESLQSGAAGYSGVMANFHPHLYSWLCKNYQHKDAESVHDFLSVASLIEYQCYPVNAKYHLQKFEGIPITTVSRSKDQAIMTETFKEEIRMLNRLTASYSYIDK